VNNSAPTAATYTLTSNEPTLQQQPTNTPTATNTRHATTADDSKKVVAVVAQTVNKNERGDRSRLPLPYKSVTSNTKTRKIGKSEKSKNHKFDPPARAIKIPFFPFLSYSHTDSVSPHFGMISQNPTIWSVLKIIKNLKTVLQKS